VLEIDGARWAVEIKLTSNPSRGDIARLQKTADLIEADRRVLVCRIARRIESESLLVVNVSGWLRALRS
jgi:hypothetical protein